MNFSKGDIVLLPYPFTDLKATKIRPAVAVSSAVGRHADLFVVPLTSRINNLDSGEFVLTDWKDAGLNVVSVVKRGCLLVDVGLIKLKIGTFSGRDRAGLDKALKIWFEL